jgi:hypothetical protein
MIHSLTKEIDMNEQSTSGEPTSSSPFQSEIGSFLQDLGLEMEPAIVDGEADWGGDEWYRVTDGFLANLRDKYVVVSNDQIRLEASAPAVQKKAK